MTIKRVRAALEGRLSAWATANDIAVAWQAVSTERATGTRHVRATLLPAETGNPTFGGDHRRLIGLMQVDVVIPDGNGMGEAETLAESLCAEFARGTSIASGGLTTHIDRSPTLRPAQPDAGWVALPVSIEYRADDFGT